MPSTGATTLLTLKPKRVCRERTCGRNDAVPNLAILPTSADSLRPCFMRQLCQLGRTSAERARQRCLTFHRRVPSFLNRLHNNAINRSCRRCVFHDQNLSPATRLLQSLMHHSPDIPENRPIRSRIPRPSIHTSPSRFLPPNFLSSQHITGPDEKRLHDPSPVPIMPAVHSPDVAGGFQEFRFCHCRLQYSDRHAPGCCQCF